MIDHDQSSKSEWSIMINHFTKMINHDQSLYKNDWSMINRKVTNDQSWSIASDNDDDVLLIPHILLRIKKPDEGQSKYMAPPIPVEWHW